MASKQEVKNENYEAAKTLGNTAGAKGMEALAALPAATAVDSKEIDELKRMNKHNLADSLANVKRLLDSTNFIEFMLAALQPLQQVFQSDVIITVVSYQNKSFSSKGELPTCSLLPP